jgi:hypothetical protein
VVEVPTEAAASERARWLAELSAALDEAQRLIWQLGVSAADSPEAMELYVRIEAARLEVQALRLSRRHGPPNNSASEWTEFSPWKRTEGSAA